MGEIDNKSVFGRSVGRVGEVGSVFIAIARVGDV
jgi:hypothetical protein